MTPWFTLPPELAAKSPPESRGLQRDEVRLLVTYKEKDRLTHATFRELPAFLGPGDLLVVNDSATIPASLAAHRPDGTAIALHLSTHRYPDRWVVEPRRVTPTPGERLSLPAGASATLIAPYQTSSRLWLATLDLPTDVLTYLHTHGRPITYDYVTSPWPLSAYQTIFSRIPGSAEMPSAARPFTPHILSALHRKGIQIAPITLHTGVASLESNEPPYEEWFHVPASTAEAVRRTTLRGGRIVAVGTTVVRALESWADTQGFEGAKPLVAPKARNTKIPLGVWGAQRPQNGVSGWTNLHITQQRGVRVVHALLTGLHEPNATHLDMLEAIAGKAHIRRAYRAALSHTYLWHEFGDVHLIL